MWSDDLVTPVLADIVRDWKHNVSEFADITIHKGNSANIIIIESWIVGLIDDHRVILGSPANYPHRTLDSRDPSFFDKLYVEFKEALLDDADREYWDPASGSWGHMWR